MSSKLNKNQIERFSRQIILRNIGTLGLVFQYFLGLFVLKIFQFDFYLILNSFSC